MSADGASDGRPLWARLLRSSTQAFLQEADGNPDLSWFDRLHGYVYARWPYLYIGVGTGEHRLGHILGPIARWLLRVFSARRGEEGLDRGAAFADTYHGKAVPLEQATQLVTVEEEICLRDLERVIPYARARDIVLKNPDHIVVLDCPCRAARPNPCEPLDVCLIVGEPFASFVAQHHPQRSRWIEPDEAVEILHAEDKRGHVHHAFFKDAMLERFYAICNCCACCCGAMQAHRTGVPMLAPSGYVCRADVELCVACAACVGACQFRALSLNNGTVAVDSDACMGCGVCISKCAQGALSLVRDERKGEPLDVRALTAGGPRS
jgi:Pyruvate/2-oxoacid:ferredoxin oxidoreductase delta subunit